MKAVVAGALLLSTGAWAQDEARLTGAELGVGVGYARGKDLEGETHGGPGVRLHLLKHLGRFFSIGPELAVYARAGSRMDVTFDGSQHHYDLRNRALLQLGGVARLGVDLGGVRPAVLFGAGWNKGTVSNLGYSVGAELEFRPTPWLPLALEGRLHKNLHNYTYETDREADYLSLGIGWRLLW
ncbi:outer membrane beta-barrel protein [Myxococcus sp. AS-1-15]|uniref:outer membrane beta-barrel protein n=1 Tax=Myxococcus sp. AS-1-15 TaxID=2874600 RepID=UPI001CC1BA49|nr:outer membrane beta-barrel protein [Myxococcus sp. AS-1-15]MBZ4400680.1 porin family protein [Myxococcus sp. AS-1-15]